MATGSEKIKKASLKSIKTGRTVSEPDVDDVLSDLFGDDDATVEEGHTHTEEKEEEEKQDQEGTEKEPVKKVVEVTGDPYTEMVVAFREFVATHPMVKGLKLKLLEQKPGHFTVYQGQPDIVWLWLKQDASCRFERKSILRVIQSLEKDHPLYMYFHNYSLITGDMNNNA